MVLATVVGVQQSLGDGDLQAFALAASSGYRPGGNTAWCVTVMGGAHLGAQINCK
jgi:hypothetical protein